MTIRASDKPIALVDPVSSSKVSTTMSELDSMALMANSSDIFTASDIDVIAESYNVIEEALTASSDIELTKVRGSVGEKLEEIWVETKEKIVKGLEEAKRKYEESEKLRKKLEKQAEEYLPKGDGGVLPEQMPDTNAPYENEYKPVVITDSEAGACIPCGSIEPCCIKSAIVKDCNDPSRQLEWPYKKGKPTSMYVVANETIKLDCAAKVDLILNSNTTCQRGVENYPGMRLDGHALSKKNIGVAKKVSVKYPLNNWIFSSALSCKYTPKSFLFISYFFFAVFDLVTQRSIKKVISTVKPYQCGDSVSCFPQMSIIPVPLINLTGNLGFQAYFKMTTVGIDWDAGVSGDFTLIYGDTTYKCGEKEKNISEYKESSTDGDSGFVSKIIDRMKVYLLQHSDSSMNGTDFASSITVSFDAGITVAGFNLKGKEGSPDLLCEVGEFVNSYSLSLVGKLDLIDALVILLAKKKDVAEKVAMIRAKMAKGLGDNNSKTKVRGLVRADLIIGGTGSIEYKVPALGEVTIPVESDIEIDGNLGFEQKNEIKIFARLECVARIDYEAWIVTGSAGAEGSVHTSFLWQWKFKGSEKFERFYFEGVRAKCRAYVKVGSSWGDEDDSGISLETNVGQGKWTLNDKVKAIEKEGERVEIELSESKKLDSNVNSEDDNIKPDYIVEPTVRNFNEDTSPPWIKVS
jgi:hypothetical protein